MSSGYPDRGEPHSRPRSSGWRQPRKGRGWPPLTEASSASAGHRISGPWEDKPLNAPIVGIAPTPDGGGFWLVASDGGVFAFGNASFYGSTAALKLNKPIVGIAATHDGAGTGLWPQTVACSHSAMPFSRARWAACISTRPWSASRPIPMGPGIGQSAPTVASSHSATLPTSDRHPANPRCADSRGSLLEVDCPRGSPPVRPMCGEAHR